MLAARSVNKIVDGIGIAAQHPGGGLSLFSQLHGDFSCMSRQRQQSQHTK